MMQATNLAVILGVLTVQMAAPVHRKGSSKCKPETVSYVFYTCECKSVQHYLNASIYIHVYIKI